MVVKELEDVNKLTMNAWTSCPEALLKADHRSFVVAFPSVEKIHC